MSDEYDGILGRQLGYDDVMLEPRYSMCKTRSDVDITVKLGDWTFNSPVVPANMKTVINKELAIALAQRGYFYVMHRFGVDSFEFVKKMLELKLCASISVGVNGVDRELIDRLATYDVQPHFITIDIAHGYSEHMIEMIEYIKDRLQDTFVIAGNVCDVQAVKYLYDTGADAVKVGVGPGHACTTRLQTGFFRPQFSAVLECCDTTWAPVGCPIIADGGIKHNGDITKALVAGATMVMCGHHLAGYEESPGDKIQMQDGVFKEYYGSASEHNKAQKKHIEGRRLYIPVRGSIWSKYQEMEDSLRSSCSYAGTETLNGLPSITWKMVS